MYGSVLSDDFGFVFCQCRCDRSEDFLQLGIFILGGQGLGPVDRDVEVAAAIVEASELARGRFVMLEELAGSGVERVCKHLG